MGISRPAQQYIAAGLEIRTIHSPRLGAGRLRPAACWARPICLLAPPGPRSLRRVDALCRTPFPFGAATSARRAPALRARCDRAFVAELAVLPLRGRFRMRSVFRQGCSPVAAE